MIVFAELVRTWIRCAVRRRPAWLVIGSGTVLVLLGLVLLPEASYAWTPGTHVFLGQAVLGALEQLPVAVADTLRAFPYEFLYGSIAADTSIAKKYAPVGRHCHSWTVGFEIFDRASDEALRSFGMGYLADSGGLLAAISS